VVEESWRIASPVAVYDTLTVDACVPVDETGAPLATAADIVLAFPFPTEESAIHGIGRPLATRYGFTLLAVRFPPPESLGRELGHHRDYYFPASGSDRAWIEALTRVRTRFGLPTRKVFATGRSGGGSAAHQFVEAHPELIEAYQCEAGRYFVEKPRFLGPLLLTFGEGDKVEAANRTLIAALQGTSCPLWVLPFHADLGLRAANSELKRHCLPPVIANESWAWIAGLADLRLEHDGKLPAPSQWPVATPVPLPSVACAQLAAKIAPPSERIGDETWIVRPAGAPRAIVIISWHDFAVDPDDVWMDGQQIADSGYLAVVSTGPADALVESARKLNVGDVPMAIVTEDGDTSTVSDLMRVEPKQIFLVMPRRSVAATLHARQGTGLICYASVESLNEWAHVPDIEALAMPAAANPGAQHVALMRDITQRLGSLAAQ
jgi:hypothetical protein